MKRRLFLKTTTGVAATLAFNKLSFLGARTSEKNDRSKSYKPGESISEDAFVHDKDLNVHKIVDLCSQEPKAKINLLYIYGGGANNHPDRLGGIWCPDSFEDSHSLRFLEQKYDDVEVRILPVACAPVYSSHYYGFDRRAFLDEADDSEKFKASVEAFVESTEEVVQNEIIPVYTYYDLRHRLLFNRREDLKPGKDYGPIFEWQGRFRADSDTQKYGTPTVWLIDSKGKVLAEPFWGNYYHSNPFEINYTIVDLDRAIQKHL